MWGGGGERSCYSPTITKNRWRGTFLHKTINPRDNKHKIFRGLRYCSWHVSVLAILQDAFRAFHNDLDQVQKYLLPLHIGSVQKGEVNTNVTLENDFRNLRQTAETMVSFQCLRGTCILKTFSKSKKAIKIFYILLVNLDSFITIIRLHMC